MLRTTPKSALEGWEEVDCGSVCDQVLTLIVETSVR